MNALRYTETYDDQIQRVRWTLDQLNKALPHIEAPIIADLSCGDGMILNALMGTGQKIYGDIMWGPHIDVLGPIEETIETTMFDMLICTQTLEYLLDSHTFLWRVRNRARYAVFTSPLGENFWDEDASNVAFRQALLLPRQFAVFDDGRRTLQLWVVQSVERSAL